MQKGLKAVILSSSLLLTACFGNGYEGTYKSTASSEPIMGNTGVTLATGTFKIGADFIEQDGNKFELESIEKNEHDGKKYLVFTDKNGSKDEWEIVDSETLVKKAGYMKITLTKIDD